MDTLRPRFDELPDALLSRQQIRTPFPEWHAENGRDLYYIQIDSYNYGTSTVPVSTVTMQELKEHKVTVGWAEDDEHFLRLTGEVPAAALPQR